MRLPLAIEPEILQGVKKISYEPLLRNVIGSMSIDASTSARLKILESLENDRYKVSNLD